jgi:response regulator RpfG family c-di-GMP phosphodiesterase
MKDRADFRILIIDATRNALIQYQRVLQSQGYSVDISTFQTEKSNDIERLQPGLIIFDLLVDVTQEQLAWQLIKDLKASPLTNTIPLLLCTATLLLPDFSHYLKDMLVPTLFKPFHLTELLQRVNDIRVD